MSEGQIVFVSAALVILITVTMAVQFRWLPQGRAKTIVVFLAGMATVVSLRIAALPPDWFSGSKSGFAIALGLALSAFVLRGVEERSFGFPLLMGMASTLLIANAIAAVRNVL